MRHLLEVSRVEVLLDRREHGVAEMALAGVEAAIEDPLLRERAELCRARLELARDPAAGLDVCRRLAAEAGSQEVRAQALRLVGAHYEEAGRYDRALLAYSGRCPVEGGAQTP